MKKTINQIRVELSKLSLAHAQINSFFWGDFLRAYKESELDYPLSCCYYPTANLYTNQTEIPITIIICDKIYKDWSNLNDVESDTLKICRDLFNVINMSQTWQLLGRVQSCTVTKFVERGGDEVAGHQMQINFRIRDKSGICDLPIFGYDFDQDFTTGCEPVLIFKDGLLIDTVPSGGIYEYFSDVCEDARVRNSDNSYSDVVESGGTLVLPDITVTDSDGNTYTQPAVTDVTCTIPPPCEDATFNINEIEVGTAPSGGSLDLNLIDQNSDEVLFVQVGSDLVITLPSAGTNSAPLMKTGQTTSYRTGDDGDIEAGRAVDWFNLDFVNFFGHSKRFTGITGGWQSEINNIIYDKDGVVTTSALAFPNDIVLDWSTYNSATGEVLGYRRVSIGNYNWANGIDACLAYSVGAFTSGWRMINKKELENIIRENQSQLLNNQPFNLQSITLWTSTDRIPNFKYRFASANTTPYFVTSDLTLVTTTFPTRTFNTSEL
jgi:hypothetical protein